MGIVLLAGLVGLSGCGEGMSGAGGFGDEGGLVCVVKPDKVTASSEVELGLISELYPDVQVVELDDFARAEHVCLGGGGTMIILAPERFPVRFWSPLERYLNAGGRALFLGRSPFQARVRRIGGEREDIESVRLTQLQQAVTAGSVSSVQLWGPRTGGDEASATVRIAHDEQLPWSGVAVTVPDYKRFNMLASPVWPGVDFQWKPGINALGFYALGSDDTSRLSVRCEDVDGVVWTKSVELSSVWSPFVIPFEHMQPVGGGGVTPLTAPRIKLLYVGLDNAVAPQAPGAHSYGVSDVKLVSDIDLRSYTYWPDVPSLVPPYACFDTKADYLQYMLNDEQLETGAFSYNSPLPLRKSVTRNPRRIVRTIPVFVGMEHHRDEISGWGASIVVAPGPREAPLIFGWIGVTGERDNRKWLKDVIHETVRRLQNGVFMVSPPELAVTVEANQLIPLKVKWIAPRYRAGQIRVVGELLAMDGRRLRRVASPMLSAADLNAGEYVSELSLGRSPGLQTERQDYTIRVALEDVDSNSRIFDESIQYLKVVSDQRDSSGSWLKCSGSRFLSERQAVFLMGINYNPLDNQLLPAEQRSAWLDKGVFCADQVRKDLARLNDLNINAVKVVYESVEQADALRFFVSEAEKAGIRVGVEIPALNPLHYDLEQIEELIRGARLHAQPNIFAIYLSSEPFLLTKDQRDALDPAWQQWLKVQYGSLARAEKLMGKPGWHSETGLSGPEDGALVSNGRHTVATVIYRRFVEDLLSRRCGFLVRFVRNLGCRQLISMVSAPPASTDVIPYDLTAGGIHFDFLSPSAAGVVGPKEDFMELGFVAAYARGGRGVVKPVVWSDFGASVGKKPREVDFENQERVYDHVFDMVNLSSSAGAFANCYSSARGYETADYGIVSPAGERRPVTMAFTRHARRLRNSMVYPSTWKGRVFSRSADARGFDGLYEQWRHTYADEMKKGSCVEIRPFGFGKSTEDMPRLTLGGVPFSAPAPMECANAEWGQIWLNGKSIVRAPDAQMNVAWGDRLRLELINTGVATWSPSRSDQHGTVWVRAESPRGYEKMLPVSVAPPGSSESVEWTASEAGVWTLRPVVLGVGAFGEPITIQVGGRGNY